jgi:hypothetical protein
MTFRWLFFLAGLPAWLGLWRPAPAPVAAAPAPVASLVAAASPSCAPTGPNFIIRFNHKVGKQPLVLFDQTYKDGFGEPFVVTKFKYYISGVRVLRKGKADTLLVDRPYLIDQADSTSQTIALPYPDGEVEVLTFEIGMDSAWNTYGAQSGSLDPLNGMFWTWNSGYIYGKLEGSSDSSHAPEHLLNWDIGGFHPGQNAERRVSLLLKPGTGTWQKPVLIDADVLAWFNTQHPLRIAVSPVCHQPGPLAMNVADNYAHMFSVE